MLEAIPERPDPSVRDGPLEQVAGHAASSIPADPSSSVATCTASRPAVNACPHCGSYQLQVTQGEEMKVKEIEVA